MMVEVSYVYPNLAAIKQRGGLLERWKLGEAIGCEYVEVPADLIKNQTEEKLTSLNIGDFVTEREISLLYKKDDKIPAELKYVLHSEPSLNRKNVFGLTIQPPLKWYDDAWRTKFIHMIILISKYLNYPASAIEIHPGDKRNSYENVAESIERLLLEYKKEFNIEPLILLENRTEQFISTGTDIKNYWDFLSDHYPHLINKSGIVLDVQQLYTKTKGRFLKQYDVIPIESLKAFHIHYLHRTPRIGYKIPWRFVFGKIKLINKKILINPEIHQKTRVKKTIMFCERMLI